MTTRPRIVQRARNWLAAWWFLGLILWYVLGAIITAHRQHRERRRRLQK